MGLIALWGPSAPSAQAQERAVAVVYDDSGSMANGGRWWYANYSYQALLGLLDADDEVRLVTMSQPQTVRRTNLANRRSVIQSLQGQVEPGAGTPYGAIVTATDALRQVQARKKWLVVLSDGSFDGVSGPAVRQHVRAFRNEVGGRVIFLVIGDSPMSANQLAQQAAVQRWKTDAQATIYTAASAADIIPQMQQIAADITSRTVGSPPRVQQSGNTIEVESAFPLRRLSLLEQDAQTQSALRTVQSASVEGASLTQHTTFDVQMPDRSRETLFGRVTHIERSNDAIIPAGTIRVTLDRSVAGRSIKVLPEVAARLSTSLRKANGDPVPMQNGVFRPCIGDRVQLRATLITPAGDTLLQSVQRPQQIDVTSTQNQQTTPLSRSGSGQYFQRTFTMPRDTITVSVAATYPGYFNFKSQLYTLEGNDCRPPRSLSTRPTEPWEAVVTDIPETDPQSIVPRASGTPVSASEFNNWTLSIVDRPPNLNLEVQRDSAQAMWQMKPAWTWGWPQLTPTGSFSATVELQSPRPNEPPIQETISFTVRPAPFWVLWGTIILFLLGMLLLGIYVWGIWTKPRFPSNANVVYRDADIDHKRRYRLPTSFWSRWLIPFVPEKNDVGDRRYSIQLTATSLGSQVLFPAEQQQEGMSVPGKLRKISGSATRKQDVPLFSGDTIRYDVSRGRLTYTYEIG